MVKNRCLLSLMMLALALALLCTHVDAVASASSSSPSMSTAATVNANTQRQQHPLVRWLKSKHQVDDDGGGGFVDSRIFIPALPKTSDGGGGMGTNAATIITALDDIAKGETLVMIPDSAIFWWWSSDNEDDNDDVNEDDKNDDVDEDDKNYDVDEDGPLCTLAQRLVQAFYDTKDDKHVLAQHWLGNDNNGFLQEFHPLLQWSNEGIDLVRDILGEELPPASDFGQSALEILPPAKVEDACGTTSVDGGDSTLLQTAWSIVVELNWDGALIPLLDMFPHKSGGRHNVDFAAVPWWMTMPTTTTANTTGTGQQQPVTLVASKNIAKGEPIFFSQTHCLVCNYTHQPWFTVPEYFADYGRVEMHDVPQIWHLKTRYDKNSDVGFYFSIDNDDDNNDDNAVTVVKWLTDDPPLIQHVNIINAHWKRLVAMTESVQQALLTLQEPKEARRIWEFFMAYQRALRSAVIWARDYYNNGHNSDKENEDDKNYKTFDDDESLCYQDPVREWQEHVCALHKTVMAGSARTTTAAAADNEQESLHAHQAGVSGPLDRTKTLKKILDVSPHGKSQDYVAMQGERFSEMLKDGSDDTISSSLLAKVPWKNLSSTTPLDRASSSPVSPFVCAALQQYDDPQASHNILRRCYDALKPCPDPLDYQILPCIPHSNSQQIRTLDDLPVHSSHYQKIEFVHILDLETGQTDSCLNLMDVLQSCTGFRAHYHETLVHYPVQFLPELKRVLFLGGGDLMILHELFKYNKTLELVVGMELDQDVIRSSFRNFGILPHLNNPKMQWWFGDAAKSLLMLPEAYYGTFDLVLVDLHSSLSDYLKVSHDIFIMDFAMTMLKPDGILSRNEDFVHRNRMGWAKYTMDLELHDLPFTCQQSITVMSNAIDFWNTEPLDHGIETLFFEPAVQSQHYTSPWGQYHQLAGSEQATTCPATSKRLDVLKGQNETLAVTLATPYGLLIVIEADYVTLPLEDPANAQSEITKALEETIGFRVTSVLQSPELDEVEEYEDPEESSWSLMFLLGEGYVMARAWPELQFIAFDLQLWKDFDRQQLAMAELVTAVGGDLSESTTSYRIVTAGMSGVAPLSSLKTKSSFAPNASTSNAAECAEPRGKCTAPLDPHKLGQVLNTLVDTIVDKEDKLHLVVLCGDSSSPCKGLEKLAPKHGQHQSIIEPLWPCPHLTGISQNEYARIEDKDFSLQVMLQCERETRVNLLQMVMSKGKMNGMIIDTHAPRFMGQVVHKILNNTRVREEMLEEEFFMVALQQDVYGRKEGESWSSALFERFRTEMIQFNPVYHVDASVVRSNTRFAIFSAGEESFYALLVEGISAVRERVGVELEVHKAMTGIINYVPDLKVKIPVVNQDYDQTEARTLWHSQRPLGRQAVFQFQFSPKSPVYVEDTVLYNTEEPGLHAVWKPARVAAMRNENTEFDLQLNNGQRVTVTRDEIRKLDASRTDVLGFGDPILIGLSDPDGNEEWVPGVVVEQVSEQTYVVQEYSGGLIFRVGRDFILQDGATDRGDATEPPLSTQVVQHILTDILAFVDPEGLGEVQVAHVGDGCILTAFLRDHGSSAVTSWNGQGEIVLNLFVGKNILIPKGEIFKAVQDRVPQMALMFYNEQPRGAGGVVNFETDLTKLWFGNLKF